MLTYRRYLAATMAALVIAPAARAQQPPPIRPIGPVVATAMEPLAGGLTLRVLSDGRVLVNDRQARRLLLLDSTLALAYVVLDTTAGQARNYGEGAPGAIF